MHTVHTQKTLQRMRYRTSPHFQMTIFACLFLTIDYAKWHVLKEGGGRHCVTCRKRERDKLCARVHVRRQGAQLTLVSQWWVMRVAKLRGNYGSGVAASWHSVIDVEQLGLWQRGSSFAVVERPHHRNTKEHDRAGCHKWNLICDFLLYFFAQVHCRPVLQCPLIFICPFLPPGEPFLEALLTSGSTHRGPVDFTHCGLFMERVLCAGKA